MRRKTVQPEIRSFFCCFDPLSRHLAEATKNANCFEECNVFTCNGCVNSATFKKEVRERGTHFWQGKVQNSSPILRCTFWQGKVQNSCIANFSATKVTSLPTHSLSLYLSLSISVSHRAHLTHNIGSACALPILFRQVPPEGLFITLTKKSLRKRSQKI